MKTVFFIILAIMLTGCSMFFDKGLTSRDGNGVNALALADGSGYLSTDEYNEITPFIFTDTNTMHKYLFFASDRGGNYDIYYAEMDADGKFARPVKMVTNINTINNETSPVVFYDPMSPELLISFSRGINGQPTSSLETYILDSNFNYTGELGTPIVISNNSVLSILWEGNYPNLLISSGYEYWFTCGWDGNWASSGIQSPIPNNTMPINSAGGFQTVDLIAEQTAYWYILTVQAGGRSQIYAGGNTNFFGYNFFSVLPYLSSYNDKEAIVDQDDSKVYFSSDRYGKGNYDLYRYNLVRYDTVKGVFLGQPIVTNVVTNSGYPVELAWESVPGAAYYRVWYYEFSAGTNALVGVVSQPYFIDIVPFSNVFSGYWIEAVNPFGYTESDWIYVGMPA